MEEGKGEQKKNRKIAGREGKGRQGKSSHVYRLAHGKGEKKLMRNYGAKGEGEGERGE